MGMFGKIKVRFVTMLAALGLIASAPIALTGCGTDYENKATIKAVKILESATKDVKNIGDEIKDAKALIEHIGKLEEDKQDQSGKVAEETLKALNDVKKVVDQGTALSTSDNSLVQQWDDYYNAYDAQVALNDLTKIVETVQGWPEDQFGEFSIAMQDLEKATLKAIGKDTYTISVEEQEAEQNGQEGQQAGQDGQAGQEEPTNENPNTTGNETPTPPPAPEPNPTEDTELDSPLEAAGKFIGGKAAEFRKGLAEGYNDTQEKLKNLNDDIAIKSEQAAENGSGQNTKQAIEAIDPFEPGN